MTSNPHFDHETTGTEAAQALGDSIRSKIVVITGVSPASIGASTALAVASQAPAALVLASRTPAKLDAVADEVARRHPGVAVHRVALDLASPASVAACAARVAALVPRVDVLVNNAGACHLERCPAAAPGGDGTVVDLQFLANHLGPFRLTQLLLPALRRAAAEGGAARVVNVSSHGHRISPVRFHDYQISHYVYDGVPEDEKPPRGLPEGMLRLVDGYPGFVGYGQSKTANILHATELTRRLRARGDGVLALSVHPGTIQTELSRGLDDEARRAVEGTAPGGRWKTLDQGAATTIVAAFDPALAALDVGGEVVGYLSDCQLGDHLLAEHARDPESARRLFDESERMLGARTEL